MPKLGFVQQGERLVSISGRTTAPVPRQGRLDLWLVREAQAEAKALQSRFLGAVLAGFSHSRLTVADRDTLNLVLFGHIEGPGRENRSRNLCRVTGPEFQIVA